jgi:1,4-alpha-glucan branching enzyme
MRRRRRSSSTARLCHGEAACARLLHRGLQRRAYELPLRLHLWSGAVETIDDPYRFPPLLSDFDLYLHGEGTNYESYNTLGAHVVKALGVRGVRFAVWAPNAELVTVVGEFNHWDTRRHPMRLRSGGVWELFVPELPAGWIYKYYVRSRISGTGS